MTSSKISANRMNNSNRKYNSGKKNTIVSKTNTKNSNNPRRIMVMFITAILSSHLKKEITGWKKPICLLGRPQSKPLRYPPKRNNPHPNLPKILNHNLPFKINPNPVRKRNCKWKLRWMALTSSPKTCYLLPNWIKTPANLFRVASSYRKTAASIILIQLG